MNAWFPLDVDAWQRWHKGGNTRYWKIGAMQTDLPIVATIVLNWNRKDDTLRCLASLQASTYGRNDIYVVDNASTDGSNAAIVQAFPDVRLIQNDENLGFAEGNNVGLRYVLDAGYSAVMLLNNDTVVATDAVAQLAGALFSDPHLGVTSPAIFYLDRPEVVWSAGGTINWRTGSIASTYYNDAGDTLPDRLYPVDHVSGCCMLVRSDAIKQAGVLDRRFFMYYEETEWCVRISRAGFGIAVQPQAQIWHAISPDDQLGSPTIAYYMTRNQLLFLKATQAPAGAWARTVFGQLRTVASHFIKPTSVARTKGRVPMIRAMRDFALGRYGPAPVKR